MDEEVALSGLPMGVRRIKQLLTRALQLQDLEADSSFAASNPALDELMAENDFEGILQASQYLRSGAADERQLYARLLAGINFPPDRRLAEVLHALEDESDPSVIRWLVFGLRNAASVAALDTLRDLARHPSAEVRFPVPDALSSCAHRFDEISDVLLELSRDPDSDVRWSAVFELGAWWSDTKDPRIGARLDEAKHSDPSAEVRRTADEATNRRGPA